VDAFAAFLAPLKKTRWFVYSKQPLAGPANAGLYPARFHRYAAFTGIIPRDGLWRR
jgi:hypothetical protein